MPQQRRLSGPVCEEAAFKRSWMSFCLDRGRAANRVPPPAAEEGMRTRLAALRPKTASSLEPPIHQLVVTLTPLPHEAPDEEPDP